MMLRDDLILLHLTTNAVTMIRFILLICVSLWLYACEDINPSPMTHATKDAVSALTLPDEELPFVIGHEMGHVVKEHSKNKARLAYAIGALRKGLAAQNHEVGLLAGSIPGGFAEQLTHALFSQHAICPGNPKRRHLCRT